VVKRKLTLVIEFVGFHICVRSLARRFCNLSVDLSRAIVTTEAVGRVKRLVASGAQIALPVTWLPSPAVACPTVIPHNVILERLVLALHALQLLLPFRRGPCCLGPFPHRGCHREEQMNVQLMQKLKREKLLSETLSHVNTSCCRVYVT
jgi:hypothetical protein